MPRRVEMTDALAMRAVLTLRAALESLERSEITAEAFKIIVRNEVWPVECSDADMAWAKAEAKRLGLGP